MAGNQTHKSMNSKQSPKPMASSSLPMAMYSERLIMKDWCVTQLAFSASHDFRESNENILEFFVSIMALDLASDADEDETVIGTLSGFMISDVAEREDAECVSSSSNAVLEAWDAFQELLDNSDLMV